MNHYRKIPAVRLSSGQALRPCRNPLRITGFSLVEVLVTIVILLIGLLGLAGLQGRALTSQMEAYQRSQALILLKDMVDRIHSNRKNATQYVTANPLGTGYNGSAVLSCTALTGSALDLCEWHNALLGASEIQGTSKVGAMIGARGCITEINPISTNTPGLYLVAVAWQGFNSTFAPAITCGQNQYPNTTSPNEALRRVVSIPISLPYLLP